MALNCSEFNLNSILSCVTQSSFAHYQNAIVGGGGGGCKCGNHRAGSAQSSSRESKLAALPSDEKPDGDRLSGG